MTNYHCSYFTESGPSEKPYCFHISPYKQMLAHYFGYAIDSKGKSLGDKESGLYLVEQELSSYKGLNVEKKTDIINFWEVSLLSQGSTMPLIDCTGEREAFSDTLSNGYGLPSYPRWCCPM
jgi:hypothetical protein